jgi:microcystin-dependent protein
MANNKKIGNYTGAVPIPNDTNAAGCYVSNEVSRFLSLTQWPKPPQPLSVSAGEYIFAAASGVVIEGSGTSFALAYGGAYSRTAPATAGLFSLIGTHYGNGDGSVTYNVPDVKDNFSYFTATSAPSGVYASGVVPLHSHTLSAQAPFNGNAGPSQSVQWNASDTVFTSVDGDAHNNGRSKEIIPLISFSTARPPVGSVLQFFLPTSVATLSSLLPAEVLIASGQAVSRAGYPLLFQRLGTLYGSGNGSTTFNIPDYRGLFLHAPQRGSVLQPSGYITGSGWQDDSIRAHRHSASVPFGGGTNGNAGTSNTLVVTSPATGASSIGGAESRPPNITCLSCILASGSL